MTSAHPSATELRRGEAATWGAKPESALEQKQMRLISWRPFRKNALQGFVAIELLPIGLKISDIPVLISSGKAWATLPSKPVLGADGKQVEVGGRRQYTPVCEWRSRDLSDGFSRAVIAAVRAQYPSALDGAPP
jgi:hypothetical protein